MPTKVRVFCCWIFWVFLVVYYWWKISSKNSWFFRFSLVWLDENCYEGRKISCLFYIFKGCWSWWQWIFISSYLWWSVHIFMFKRNWLIIVMIMLMMVLFIMKMAIWITLSPITTTTTNTTHLKNWCHFYTAKAMLGLHQVSMINQCVRAFNSKRPAGYYCLSSHQYCSNQSRCGGAHRNTGHYLWPHCKYCSKCVALLSAFVVWWSVLVRWERKDEGRPNKRLSGRRYHRLICLEEGRVLWPGSAGLNPYHSQWCQPNEKLQISAFPILPSISNLHKIHLHKPGTEITKHSMLFLSGYREPRETDSSLLQQFPVAIVSFRLCWNAKMGTIFLFGLQIQNGHQENIIS